MFEDQLFKITGLKNKGKFIKTADLSRQFHTTHQINCDIYPIFAKIIQEAILYVLSALWVIVHS